MTAINLQTVSNAPYLRVQRNFPDDSPQTLSVEVDKMYVDVAACTNARTIGLYSTKALINGESFYLTGTNSKQQVFRQVFVFTSDGTFPHGINFLSVAFFTRISGTILDNAGNWYPLPLVDVVNVTNQISIKVNSTNIIVTRGATAPVVSKIIVILEWATNV